jgi:predicted nucleotidyltransferase
MTQASTNPQEQVLTLDQLLHEKRDDIKGIAARHGAYNIRVFGSVARGEAGPESDIDILIDVGPTTSSWFPAGLILDLEDLLGRRVEVITEKALNPELRDHVLREAIPL